jgi:hypothetical protein
MFDGAALRRLHFWLVNGLDLNLAGAHVGDTTICGHGSSSDTGVNNSLSCVFRQHFD